LDEVKDSELSKKNKKLEKENATLKKKYKKLKEKNAHLAYQLVSESASASESESESESDSDPRLKAIKLLQQSQRNAQQLMDALKKFE